MIPGQTQLASIHASAAAPLSRIAAGNFSQPKPRQQNTKRRIATIFLEGLLTPDYLSFIRGQLFAALADSTASSSSKQV